jgi:predicted small metal-binding protein
MQRVNGLPAGLVAREIPGGLLKSPGLYPVPGPAAVGRMGFFNQSDCLSHGTSALHLFNIKNGECCYLYEVVPILFFCCKDCGLDCSFQATGMTQQEIARTIIQHMDTVHGMNVIPADFMIKIKHAIKNKNAVKTISLVPETAPLVVSIR